MTYPAHIVTDTSLAEGVMIGLDSHGVIIVELQIMPVFKRLIGTQDDEREVTTWRVGKDQARRIAAVAAWNSMGNVCGGSA